MMNYTPLPDISHELRGGRTTKQILIQDMEYLADEMYYFLPKVEFLSDGCKLKLIRSFINELEHLRNSRTDFDDIVKDYIDEYNFRTTVEQRKKARLRIPEIVKDKSMVNVTFELGETVQQRMKEQKYPAHLTMTVPRCLERVRNGIKCNTINMTRDMVKAIKMIKLGTEKEKKHDAEFFVTRGVQDLKQAVAKEFTRSKGK